MLIEEEQTLHQHTIPTVVPPQQHNSFHLRLQVPRLQVRPHNKQHNDTRNNKSNRRSDDPEDTLRLAHVANVLDVHAQVASDEGEREEDDGHDGEDQNGFFLGLGADGDRLASLIGFC
jgi:hypothetical protein